MAPENEPEVVEVPDESVTEVVEVDAAPEVVLGDNEQEGDTIVNEGDVTVVVDAPADDPEPGALDAVEVDNLITLTERVTRLEENQEAQNIAIAELHTAAVVAEVEAEIAEVEAQEAVEEAEEVAEELDTLEEEEAPEPRSAGAHPWFRGWRDTFGRDR